MSVAEQQVESLLENVLFESSTQAATNAESWLGGLSGASSTLSGLAAAMAASPEESIAAHVVGYYLAALGRAPNAAEIRYYVGVAEQGLTPAQIAAGQVSAGTWDTIASYFTQSPEFTARAGLDMSLGETAALFEAVPWLYQSVLGRTPSGFEISYYDNQIAAGGGMTTLFREFTASPEFATDTAAQIAAALAAYGTTVASGQDPAAIGASVTLGPPAPPVVDPPPAPTPPPTPAPTVFTTGTDNFTTTDGSLIYTATLGGVSPTLTPNDNLHGAGNTLNITDTSGATSQDLIPSGVSLTGVATITLTTSGNAGTDSSHPFDLSGVTGLTGFTLTASGTQGDFIAAGSSATVTVHGASSLLSVAGFASLAVISNGLATLDLSGTGGAITFTDPTGPTSLTINASALTQFGNITDASNHITTLTIDGGSGAASSIDNHDNIGGYSITDTALTSLTVRGNVTFGAPLQGVNLPSSLTLFNSSNATGPIYINHSGSGAIIALGNNGAYLTDSSGNTITGTGNGAEIFTSGTGTGESIAFSNGNSSISLGNAGGDTVTLGNGNNDITISAASSSNVITVANGNNVITDNSAVGNNTVNLGTGNNTANMNGVANETITVGTDAAYNGTTDSPNLVINNPGSNLRVSVLGITTFSATSITSATPVSSPSNEISTLEAQLVTAHTADSFIIGEYDGNTYIVVSASGTTLSSTDTTIIELTGTGHLLGASGNTLLL